MNSFLNFWFILLQNKQMALKSMKHIDNDLNVYIYVYGRVPIADKLIIVTFISTELRKKYYHFFDSSPNIFQYLMFNSKIPVNYQSIIK